MASRLTRSAADKRGVSAAFLVVVSAGCAAPHSLPAPAATSPPSADAPHFVHLESLDLSALDQEWGEPAAAKAVEGNPLRIAGITYSHGLGTHAHSEIEIALHGEALRFEALVGVDDETDGLGSVVFVVEVDGRSAFRSEVIRAREAARPVRVDLAGARQMTLKVEDGGDGINYDHANWAEAVIVLRDAAAQRPLAQHIEQEPAPDIAPFDPYELAIHPPRIVGATPGRPFLFRIPASGRPPLRFAAEGLPAGLRLDAEAGIISGSLVSAGRSDVRLTVQAASELANSTLTIIGGEGKLALTPPMGWNSWNSWATAVDEHKVRDAADWLVFSGLASRGYQYVNIDDAWEGARGEDGVIRTNEKFLDMRELADYVHAHGLKLGVYSSPGPRTCANYEGSFGYEFADAAQYAAWGIDYLKHDWCSYGQIVKDQQPLTQPGFRHPYEVMRLALDSCGRDIVYSLCQYGMGDVWTWGDAVGGNLWRTTGDIIDTWSSMSRIGFSQSDLAPHAQPGRWNDPDMLVLGKVGWGPNLHPTRLTPNEQVTHMTLWALLAAPLLIGCDLTDMDEFTLAVLGNPEVIEIDQDPLGRPAKRISVQGKLEVWARPLANGDTAVGLFNRGRTARTMTVTWSQLGLPGPQRVRNVWRRADLGAFETHFESIVAAHGAALIRVSPPE